jgi:hypothetical protein
MFISPVARVLCIALLGLAVLGASVASAWHEVLFHAEVSSCDHPIGHDHDEDAEDEGRETCPLCDFYFYAGLPLVDIPGIWAARCLSAYMLPIADDPIGTTSKHICYRRGPPHPFTGSAIRD